MSEKATDEIKKELNEKCKGVRYLVVCQDDEVVVRVGRYYWEGKVLEIGKLGMVILNGNEEHSIALNKIASITVVQDGKYRKAFREIYGKTTMRPVE
ncbi:MAG: hypothetical protein CBR30_09675 [Dictyoglomus sp. NZ13-RE01]|nr:MAG: hypothetical protein CBR30_09675 [Dictyoglomus sp. NZ13-RE01]